MVPWSRLIPLIAMAFELSRGRYGSPRLTTALAASGFVVGRRRVIAAMQHLGLEARRGDKPPERSNRKSSRRTFASREVVRCCRPDLVRRAFDVVIPNTVWVADVTHLGGDATQRYLCIIIDLASRRVVAWRTGNSANSALVASTLQSAFKHRRPGPGLIVHSDRGGEFANRKIAALVRDFGATQSMSRRGNCWDNAVAESFFATLKRECLYLLESPKRWSPRKVIGEYIAWYNDVRLHSTLGYRSPSEFEASEFGIPR